ncbi:hypothetical protein ACQKGC_15820 [Allorhizobium pseudoryzae]|uniref:hypothetical protein n=1 Tax=Allorhizobium pseudoryzae TaxID=379684 RepID=UPI003D042AC2
MTHPHQVTDKAILRFMQLVHGFDAEQIRAQIAALAERGIREGATGIIAEGVKLVVSDGRVVNVVHRHTPSCYRDYGAAED